MFIEFEHDVLERWNNLSKEEKEKALKAYEAQIAINVDIKIESHDKISEEHKYYQVTNHMILIDDIRIIGINEQETTFSIKTFNGNDEPKLISIKTNEEKEIEVGTMPYISIYRIKVSDIKYGIIVEL